MYYNKTNIKKFLRQDYLLSMSKKTYKPGEKAGDSGQYKVIGPRGGLQDREVTVTKGEPLPPTPKPNMKYRLVDKTKHK